jgi:hypothetical protein
MAQPLIADQLIEKAQRATGLERFDSMSFREGFDILLADMNKQNIPDALMPRTEAALLAALSNRLKVTACHESRPDLATRPIERPIFVFGVPRTGTTLLSNLLAADPNRRSPLTWEIDDPVPPATTATLYSDPRAVAALEQERAMLAANPDMGKYYRNSAIYPNECIFFMHSDFKTLDWESRGKLPAYKEFIFSADTTSMYEYHKKFLQVLQADAPGVWNLKMPSHALWLDTILKIYPDARFVWSHRDPLTATSSFCSLITLGHRGSVGHIDREWIAEDMPWQAVLHAERIMDFRDKHGEDRVLDVHYADLMHQPIETMRKLYAGLGDEFTPQAEASMQTWIDDNPQGKFGRHEYKLAEFGLTPDGLRKSFERYLSRYKIEAEG